MSRRSSTPFFSVVIPAYQASGFIAEALDSVNRQSWRDYGIIVVDDGSSDNTSSVVTEWAKRNEGVPVKLIRQQNRGIGGARNRGIQVSTGEYVAFLDADDIWMESKLERVAAYLRVHGTTDLLCHDEWLDENGQRKLLRHGPYRSYQQLLFKGNCLSTSAIVVRTKILRALGGFSEDLDFNGVEDYELWLRIARSGAEIDYLHEVLGTYRVHGHGITSRIEEHCRHYINVVEAHARQAGPPDMLTRVLLRKRRSQILRGAGRAYLKQDNFAGARKFLNRSVAQWPFSWKTAALGFLALVRVPI